MEKKVDFKIMEDNISLQISSLKLEHEKVKYQPKCRLCKEHCIARAQICITNCKFNKRGFCEKYNELLEMFEDLYFKCENCFDEGVNNYLKDKL